MKLFTILSRLLDYPTDELMQNLDLILNTTNESTHMTAEEKKVIKAFVSWMCLHGTTGLQEQYVKTFDMVAEHDLHITHHLFGEERTRGPALIDLSEHYRHEGLELTKKGEIPDYIPLMLEYISLLDDLQSRMFLGEIAKVLEILADNLDKVQSPYAPLLRVLEQRGRLAQVAA